MSYSKSELQVLDEGEMNQIKKVALQSAHCNWDLINRLVTQQTKQGSILCGDL